MKTLEKIQGGLYWTIKSKTPSHCGFPLANPYDALNRDFVPPSIVTEDPRFITDLNNQSTIFMLNNIYQE